MDSSIIGALITASFALFGTLLSNFLTHNSTKKSIDSKMDAKIAVIEAKIDNLEKKQQLHNNLIERMASVEQGCKSAHKRLDEIHDEIRFAN